MEVHEIFAKLKARILEGMVFHDEMIRYYGFLNLDDWVDEHTRHYEDEAKGYRKLGEYYMNHYNRLIPNEPMKRPDIIPDSWYRYSRQEVDTNTKKNSMKVGLRKWVEWEKETKHFYQDMCKALIDMGEIAAAHLVVCYITDVDEELKRAEKKHIIMETTA